MQEGHFNVKKNEIKTRDLLLSLSGIQLPTLCLPPPENILSSSSTSVCGVSLSICTHLRL